MKKITILNITLLALIFNYSSLNAENLLPNTSSTNLKQFEQTRRGLREEKSANYSQENLMLSSKVSQSRQRGTRISLVKSSIINIDINDFLVTKRIKRGKRINGDFK